MGGCVIVCNMDSFLHFWVYAPSTQLLQKTTGWFNEIYGVC